MDIYDNFCDALGHIQPLNLKPDERSFEYYKGFYDATHQFIQIFEKLIEAGAFSGTETNSHN